MSDESGLVPVRAMLSRLNDGPLETLIRAKHAELFAPATARRRRVAELGFLASLLEERPQPLDRLPYVERRSYERRRPDEAREAPTADWLSARYGSWKRACVAAWGLLQDGRRRSGTYEPRLAPGTAKPRRYTAEECTRSVRQCADTLGFIPSSGEYHAWQLERVRQAKTRGHRIRLAPYRAVLHELAPERTTRDGWRIVLSKLFGKNWY